jgi:hypothetical protein
LQTEGFLQRQDWINVNYNLHYYDRQYY